MYYLEFRPACEPLGIAIAVLDALEAGVGWLGRTEQRWSLRGVRTSRLY
jgi:hypothetical protein